MSENRFALEGHKQLLTWLVTASGIILGLIGFSSATLVQDVQKLGVGALLVSIISGIFYMNVMAGAISEEDEHRLLVEKFSHELAAILLSIAYWSFILGVLSIFAGILALPAS